MLLGPNNSSFHEELNVSDGSQTDVGMLVFVMSESALT